MARRPPRLRCLLGALWRRRPVPIPATPQPAEPVRSWTVGGLLVTVVSRGELRTLDRPGRIVDRVTVEDRSGRRWTTAYGFAPAIHSVTAATSAALDELELLHLDPDRWRRDWSAGLSGREAEAMLERPQVDADLAAAAWAGPLLSGGRGPDGSWQLVQVEGPP